MKFDKQKAFPYPVLRPESNDYLDVDFQTTCELKIGEERVKILISYAISSEEIIEEIEQGNAEYLSIISCRDTYFRLVLSSINNEIETEINIGDLRGEIKIDSYIVVREDTSTYKSQDVNPEFGSGPFKFDIGNVYAQDEPQVFYIDRDLFKPVSSVFELVKKDNLTGGHWTIGFAEDYVQIEVSPELKEAIDDARNVKENRVILLNSIYFAAVMQAIQKLKDSSSDYEDRKWAEVIMRQAHNQNRDLDTLDAYEMAEHLMKYPLFLLHTVVLKGKQ